MSEFGQKVALRAESEELVVPAFDGRPPLPHERHAKDRDLRLGRRVAFLFYRTWMDGPQLSLGRIASRNVDTRSYAPSPGFVNLKTAKTDENRTGSLIGVDMHSATLIPRAAWPHLMTDDEYFEAWVAGGSVAWPEERDQLEELLLAERNGDGHINWSTDPATGNMNGEGSARLHTAQSFSGRVLPHPPAYV